MKLKKLIASLVAAAVVCTAAPVSAVCAEELPLYLSSAGTVQVTADDIFGSWDYYKVQLLYSDGRVDEEESPSGESCTFVFNRNMTVTMIYTSGDNSTTTEGAWKVAGGAAYFLNADGEQMTLEYDGRELYVLSDIGYGETTCTYKMFLRKISSDTAKTAAGDFNFDGIIDSADASLILALNADGADISSSQLSSGDINGDGLADPVDASLILAYNAYVADGGSKTISEWSSEIA